MSNYNRRSRTRREREYRRRERITTAGVVAFLFLCVWFCVGFTQALAAAAW